METPDPDRAFDPKSDTAKDDIVTEMAAAMLKAASAIAEQRGVDQKYRAWYTMYAAATQFTALLHNVPDNQRDNVVRGVNAMFANLRFPWRLRQQH